MNVSDSFQRPRTCADIAASADSLASFGCHLRDWQHELQRGGVTSRPELAKRLEEPPVQLRDLFPEGDIADAMLAAYVEWIADEANIPRPDWVSDSNRVAQTPWFGSPARAWLLANTPASFRQRGLFTIPEPVFTARRGRPRVSAASKQIKARERQKAYRARIRALVAEARASKAL